MIKGNEIIWKNTKDYYEISSLPPNDNGYRVLVLTENNHLHIGYEEYEDEYGHSFVRVDGIPSILKEIVVAWQPIWLPKDFIWNEIVRSLELTDAQEKLVDMYKKIFEKLIFTRDDKE